MMKHPGKLLMDQLLKAQFERMDIEKFMAELNRACNNHGNDGNNKTP